MTEVRDEVLYEEPYREPYAEPLPPPWYRNPLAPLGLLVVAAVAGILLFVLLRSDDDSSNDASPSATATTGAPAGTNRGGGGEPARSVTVADAVGRSQVAAGSEIEADGLAADTYPVPSSRPRGTVISQRPPAGSELREGAIVRLNVSIGPGARGSETVPDVTGPSASNARAEARKAGFTARTVLRDAPTPEEEGEVILQRPGPGATLPTFSQLTLYVGR